MKPALLLLAAALLCFAPSCKKGCTKPYADNYDPQAKVEDGTCLSCVHEFIDSVSRDDYYRDYVYPSPYYYDSIILFKTHYTLETYIGNDCQRQGLAPECVNDSLRIKNYGRITIDYVSVITDTILCDVYVTYHALDAEPLPTFREIRGVRIPPQHQGRLIEITVPCVHTNTADIFTSYSISNLQYY